ncbi:MAG: pyruvate kinase [Candidatus Omnitrophota bacterium]
MARTKIICTLGPASESAAVIRKMAEAGMDVARLNLSHGTIAEQRRRIEVIRGFNRAYRRAIKILLDLEGHRIRVGRLKGRKLLELKRRQIFFLRQEDVIGSGNVAGFDYEGPISDIRKGQEIFIDDGNIALKVLSVKGTTIKTEVMTGGLLGEFKGINIPAARLHFSGLSEKDREDLKFAVKEKADYVAQSFVRNIKDIREVADILKPRLPQCQVIAKIEDRAGIKNVSGIMDNCDGIMIARGDMGVSLPLYEVPIKQKEIIKKCNAKNKPVITATQMLESMVNSPRPTRAEVSDVANAILDGTDFVMLSAETAAGKFPVEAVKMMNDIIKFIESSQLNKSNPSII